ncbi:cation:proton antiporter subunit C [Peptococcaceae bacterium]|nr:cation:proton antiporter subunit C [Peptococcaceae bacterium]MCL0049495.1 cation:proton antiporter subunit C [Peptococcaceae bacterium]
MSLEELIAGYLNWFLIAVLFIVGTWGLIVKENLLKKVMALNVVQIAVILFFINSAQKLGATLPTLREGEKYGEIAAYANPLPHALMLTAIVVALAIIGVALTLVLKIYKEFGTIEEREIHKKMCNGE